jgi:hypothetical protein
MVFPGAGKKAGKKKIVAVACCSQQLQDPPAFVFHGVGLIFRASTSLDLKQHQLLEVFHDAQNKVAVIVVVYSVRDLARLLIAAEPIRRSLLFHDLNSALQ